MTFLRTFPVFRVGQHGIFNKAFVQLEGSFYLRNNQTPADQGAKKGARKAGMQWSFMSRALYGI
jgi:hypothetical protein